MIRTAIALLAFCTLPALLLILSGCGAEQPAGRTDDQPDAAAASVE